MDTNEVPTEIMALFKNRVPKVLKAEDAVNPFSGREEFSELDQRWAEDMVTFTCP